MTVSACARNERSTASPLQLFNRARQAREAAGHLVQRGFLFGVGEPDVAPSRLRVMEKTAPRDGGHTELFHQKLRERHIILTELADVRDDVVGPGGHDGAKSRLTQDVQHAISLA